MTDITGQPDADVVGAIAGVFDESDRLDTYTLGTVYTLRATRTR